MATGPEHYFDTVTSSVLYYYYYFYHSIRGYTPQTLTSLISVTTLLLTDLCFLNPGCIETITKDYITTEDILMGGVFFFFFLISTRMRQGPWRGPRGSRRAQHKIKIKEVKPELPSAPGVPPGPRLTPPPISEYRREV